METKSQLRFFVGALLLLFAHVLTAATSLAAIVETEEKEKKRPNVLFIAIDDLNDWIGCLKGHPQIKTPNIDALAARGMLFTNAHTQAPLCNPSRTSVMTGLRPSTTGVYGLSPWIRNVDELKNLVTLPQHFSQNGYTTYSAGKIYHNNFGRRKSDNEFDVLGPGTNIVPRPPKKLIGFTPGGNHDLMDWGTFAHRDEEKGDFQVASWAVSVLDKKPKDPFFLSVGFFLPHVPLYVTEKWYDMYPFETLQLPPILDTDRDDTPRFSWFNHWKLPEPRLKWLREANQLKPMVRSYLAAISFVDSQVGRVLDALDRNELADNTVIVLWSDHGYHLGEKAISGKNTLWEPSTRVPLIFAGPEIVAGQNSEDPAELLDIYPTLNELCDLPQRPELEGHSLKAQLEGATETREWPAITTANQNNHAIRTKEWRFIRYADGSEELYKIADDPNEWNNLANSGEYEPVKTELALWIPEINSPPCVGSKHRLLQYENGVAIWQGEVIGENDPIPDVETEVSP